MSIGKTFVIQKLNQMKGYLDEARPILGLPLSDILNKSTNLYTLERLLQLVVDQAIDINKHLIKELELRISDDLQGTFIAIAEHNILPMDFAKKIAPVVGLRNRLVHRYEKVDNKRFIRDFKKNCDDFDRYMYFINNYLEGHLSE